MILKNLCPKKANRKPATNSTMAAMDPLIVILVVAGQCTSDEETLVSCKQEGGVEGNRMLVGSKKTTMRRNNTLHTSRASRYSICQRSSSPLLPLDASLLCPSLLFYFSPILASTGLDTAQMLSVPSIHLSMQKDNSCRIEPTTRSSGIDDSDFGCCKNGCGEEAEKESHEGQSP